MENGFYFSIAAAIILALLPFVTPMPKPVAWAGIVGALIIMLAELAPTERRPSIWVVVLLMAGLMALAGSAYLYFNPEKSSKPGPLAGLTNSQLRERTISFAQSLLALENSSQQERNRLMAEHFAKSRTLSSREDQTAEFESFTERMSQLSQQQTVEFQSKYRPDAIILYEELQHHLGSLPDPPATTVVGRSTAMIGRNVLEGSNLAGPYPLANAAGLLEYWASRLP